MKYLKIFLWFISTFFLFNISCLALDFSNETLFLSDRVNVNSATLKIPIVSSEDKIYDYLNLLSKQDMNNLKNKIDDFVKETKIDIAIVITNELYDLSINEYSNNFYDYNNFLDEGVVFVIYLNEKEPEIYMGNNGDKSSKIFNIYNDKRIKQILTYIYKDIESENYSKAINDYITILDGFYRLAGENYKVSQNGKIVKIIPWLEISVNAVCLTFILIILLISRFYGKKKIINYQAKIDYNSLMIKTEYDKLISNKVSN